MTTASCFMTPGTCLVQWGPPEKEISKTPNHPLMGASRNARLAVRCVHVCEQRLEGGRTGRFPLERRIETSKAICHLPLLDGKLHRRLLRRIIRANCVPLLLRGLVDARLPLLTVRGHAAVAALRARFQDEDELCRCCGTFHDLGFDGQLLRHQREPDGADVPTRRLR